MKKLLLTAIGVAFLGLNAQTGYYQVPGASTGNPGSLNSDAEYPPGGGLATGWTTVVTGPQSQTWSAAQNIPFNFKFNGTAVTQYKIGSTGIVTFDVGSSTACPSATPAALPSASIPNQSVVIWGVDAKLSGDYVVTKTFGTAPNRQHWIMYASCTEANLLNGWAYMSIVLEEGTNNIHIVDQRSNCVNGQSACSNKTKLTVGIQIDGSTAVSVNGSPNYAMVATNDPTTVDNVYYTFSPGTLVDNDLTLVSVNLEEFLKNTSAPFSIKFSAKNTGGKAITSINATYSLNGGSEVTEDITGLNLASGSSSELTFPTKWTPSALGKYTIAVKINSVNSSADTFGKNTGSVAVNVLDKWIKRKILNEIYTSSTCPPCAPGNANYLNVVDGRTDHSTIKYQVYFPGTGDPYCTQESRDRMNFYAINSVPRMEIDGGWDENANSFTTALYDQYQAKPSFIEISGTAINTWKNTITANIKLTPAADITSSNLKLFAVIVEGVTYKNKKSNGETQFEDVMKKMMPNSTGMALSGLTKDVDVDKTLSWTFNGNYRLPLDGTSAQHINHATENSVETWDDLKVVVFVQDATTKEVLQSETFVVAMASTESVENNVLVYPNPSNDLFHINSDVLRGEVAQVRVTNLAGQVVYESTMSNGKAEIATADWTSGMYMVTVKSNAVNFTTKMMVRH